MSNLLRSRMVDIVSTKFPFKDVRGNPVYKDGRGLDSNSVVRVEFFYDDGDVHYRTSPDADIDYIVVDGELVNIQRLCLFIRHIVDGALNKVQATVKEA